MRKIIIAAALVSLTAVPAFAGKAASSNGANVNQSMNRPSNQVSVPSRPISVPSLPSRPSLPSLPSQSPKR
jgi:hypothetical protein